MSSAGRLNVLRRPALLPADHRPLPGGKFLSDCQDRITFTFTTPLVFWSLEFNRLSDDHVAALWQANLGPRPLQARVRAAARHAPYQLSDELRRSLLTDQSTVGASAWNKALRRDHRRAHLPRGTAMTSGMRGHAQFLLQDIPTAAAETAGFEALVGGSFKDNLRTLRPASTTRWPRKREIEDLAGAAWPAPPRPAVPTCRTHVEPEVVEALSATAVVAAYPRPLTPLLCAEGPSWLGP